MYQSIKKIDIVGQGGVNEDLFPQQAAAQRGSLTYTKMVSNDSVFETGLKLRNGGPDKNYKQSYESI